MTKEATVHRSPCVYYIMAKFHAPRLSPNEGVGDKKFFSEVKFLHFFCKNLFLLVASAKTCIGINSKRRSFSVLFCVESEFPGFGSPKIPGNPKQLHELVGGSYFFVALKCIYSCNFSDSGFGALVIIRGRYEKLIFLYKK